jgi:hypothetical protein
MAQLFTVKQTKGSRGTGIVIVRSDVTGGVQRNNASIGANTVGEDVRSMTIADVYWSLDTASDWAIKRGSTVVYTIYGPGSGSLNFADNQMRLETSAEETANVGFDLTGTGSILLKLHKRSGA